MTTEPSRVVVRTLATCEVGEYAALHCLVFPQYTSAKLGERFCRRLYEGYGTTPEVLAFGVWEEGRLLGSVIAAPDRVGRRVRRRLTLHAVTACLLKPHLFGSRWILRRCWKLMGNWVGSGRDWLTGEKYAPIGRGDRIRLINMGVHPSARGRGLGERLLRHFEREAAGRGLGGAELLVLADNVEARRLYERCGWSLDESGEVPIGCSRYVKDLGRP